MPASLTVAIKQAARELGFDAVGKVVGTGEDVTRFAQGDRVFYAGQIDRPGTNSMFHLVNENIVGRAFFVWMNFGNLGRIGAFN